MPVPADTLRRWLHRLPVVAPVGGSLQRHLLVWLLLPQLVLWLAGGPCSTPPRNRC